MTNEYDISLVLNIHSGTKYLRRTLWSLEEAANYARGLGVGTELVFVMDRSPSEACSWARAYQSPSFDHVQYIEVDNGSLGLSRNEGVRASHGEIVYFCDEDDLVSFNSIFELFSCARSYGDRHVIIPEYHFGFGEKKVLVQYLGNEAYSPLQFISDHPFHSRICLHRKVFDMLTFADVRLGSGRAYEDYHFNSQLAAAGYEFTIASNTILFYRWRKGLLHDMNAASTKQIPPTPLYDPPVYLQRCRKTYDTYETSGQPTFDPEVIWDRFNSNLACLEFIHAANAIEPAIAPWINARPFVWTNISIDQSRGAAYYRACLLVGNAKFTDVFLFPFVVRGGGDKYILNVMHGISEIDPQSKFLVLTGQRVEQHQWIHLLPDNALFVDIQELGKDLTEADVDVITLRLIDSTAPTARIHVKQSPYAQRFVSQFGHLLENNKLVFYRFCDEEFVVEGLSFVTGYAFDFLSNCGEQFDLIIADHRRIAEFDRSRLDCLKHKIRVLYTKNDVLTNQAAIERRGSCLRKRLLWASRFDRQKRPDLLLRIASRLTEIGSDVHIDVYGTPTLGGFDTAKLISTKNLTVKGPFENFGSIEHDLYDALLYTSSFDGLPIIILDALAAGLPVIATDIGGIDDAVIDGRTGFLIPRSSDDDVLIASYIDAIRRLYEKPEAYVPMRMNAVSQIEHRHAPAAFLANLADVFGLKQ